MTPRQWFIAFIVVILCGIVLAVVLAATASGAQCGCPPTPEPPALPQPLPALEPGGGYVWIAYIAASHQEVQ